MSARKKLLFFTQTLPYPPDGGVNLRTYNILRILAVHYDVDLVCFYRKEVVRDINASEYELKKTVHSIGVFPIKQEHSRLRYFIDHLRSVTRKRVYTRYVYESKEVREYLRNLIANSSPALIHMDSLDLSGYMDLFEGIPVAVTHHNIESILLSRRSHRAASKMAKTYVSHQAQLMSDEERCWAPRVALNVLCSIADEDALKSIACGAKTVVVPNGVDVNYFVPMRAPREGVVSVGGTTWFPNLDALEYAERDIVPAIRKLLPGTTVSWVGRCSDSQKKHYERSSIAMTGYVDDVRPYLADAKCFIAPLRVGGGTRLKILDAWAMGKAVVSTPIGCEGLNARDGENILIRDSPDEFAEAVVAVLNDSELRQRLETNARKTAVDEYSWSVLSDRLVGAYTGIVD